MQSQATLEREEQEEAERTVIKSELAEEEEEKAPAKETPPPIQWECRTTQAGKNWVALFLRPSQEQYDALSERTKPIIDGLGELKSSETIDRDYTHITLLFGQKDRDDPHIAEILTRHAPFDDIELGEIEHWDKGTYGFVVAKVHSDKAYAAHKELFEEVPLDVTDSYGDPAVWKAHVTLYKYSR